MNFSRYNFENGLPMSEVYKIVEDRYGFLWLFNYQMVCKFDGVNFSPYRQSQHNPSNFPRHQHTGITADKNGEIWLTHTNGTSFFDYKANKFTNFSLGFQNSESAKNRNK